MSILYDYSELNDYYDDIVYENYEESIKDVWDECIQPSIYSILPLITKLFIVNFTFGIILSLCLIKNEILYHLISAILGSYLISTLEYKVKLLVGLAFISMLIMFYLSYYLRKYVENSITIVLAVLLVSCQYLWIPSQLWLEARGIIMEWAMKLISLYHDFKTVDKRPNVFGICGYLLSGTNVIFGPWIPYKDYVKLFRKPSKKNIYWIFNMIKILLLSLFFLTLSNCWSNYFIKDDYNRWLVAYREALTFRTSHYFVCYLAELGMVAAGFTNNTTNFRFIITEPLTIEFPTALAIVVRNWNKPMHEFLKKYIYRSWLNQGKFLAIFITFLMSSFLHGLELKVFVVLITIGVFSYLQTTPRGRIADIFNCCVKVRPCKNSCLHKFKRDSIKVKILLIIYSFFTVLHLIYLGVLMDPTTDNIGILGKWQNLYFISHIIMFFNMLTIL